MAYSDFSLRKVKQDFNLTLIEGGSFLPSIQSLAPSQLLIDQLADGVPLALATGSEKARSELIISPVLMEVRRQLDRQISLFSGEDFTIAPELGLSGTCDFLGNALDLCIRFTELSSRNTCSEGIHRSRALPIFC
jgi:hypothetical protein